jgi:hypothetical protein
MSWWRGGCVCEFIGLNILSGKNLTLWDVEEGSKFLENPTRLDFQEFSRWFSLYG